MRFLCLSDFFEMKNNNSTLFPIIYDLDLNTTFPIREFVWIETINQRRGTKIILNESA